ncbi:MAG TPA: enoyl-CoA hydratase-related protein [Spongiibacteraceae bacterium]|jgi:enoyl-CoA hydratase/carnithine racemase|nr:enoyl-CoA hydratase-related protein [Spongiibacteraceae bacterium]HUH37228.1 enoyl-CoA hydratase-related protein [Spongiibacteraceae bacterium]
MTDDIVRYEVDAGIATITLNRPDAHNAVNRQMSLELPRIWQRFENDPAARVAIVTGAGERAFCSGADLADPPFTDGEGAAATLASIRWTSLQNNVWKPVICAVNGLAVGGGLHFVAESDMVIAAEHASFFDTHVKVGLVAGLEPVVLARRMPLDAVMRMALTGGKERLSARRACELGLVGEVVPGNALMSTARALAERIREHSPAALARTKRSIWASKERGLHDAMQYAWNQITAHIPHPDYREGGQAFLQKRAPEWAPYTPDLFDDAY